MKWLWLAATVILAVAAAATWWAFSSPTFVAGLAAIAAAAAWKAVVPVILKRRTLAQEAEDHRRVRMGLEPLGPGRRKRDR